MSKGLQLVAAIGLATLLIGWLVYSQYETGSFRYFETLEEFQSAGRVGEATRVQGYVAPGSIERDVAAKRVRFAVQASPPHAGGVANGTLPVVYASLETPDLFQDGAEVVVEGELEGRGQAAVFRADNVLAKCPSKFEAERMESASF